jgi:exodeoxyribonuclease VII small subunit
MLTPPDDAPAGASAGTAGGDQSLTYEQLVEALEELTRRMADGDIGIEEAVDLYERAGQLHAQAAERLARVQARIERLAGDDGA